MPIADDALAICDNAYVSLFASLVPCRVDPMGFRAPRRQASPTPGLWNIPAAIRRANQMFRALRASAASERQKPLWGSAARFADGLGIWIIPEKGLEKGLGTHVSPAFLTTTQPMRRSSAGPMKGTRPPSPSIRGGLGFVSAVGGTGRGAFGARCHPDAPTPQRPDGRPATGPRGAIFGRSPEWRVFGSKAAGRLHSAPSARYRRPAARDRT